MVKYLIALVMMFSVGAWGNPTAEIREERHEKVDCPDESSVANAHLRMAQAQATQARAQARMAKAQESMSESLSFMAFVSGISAAAAVVAAVVVLVN